MILVTVLENLDGCGDGDDRFRQFFHHEGYAAGAKFILGFAFVGTRFCES